MSDFVEEFMAFEETLHQNSTCNHCQHWQLDYIGAVYSKDDSDEWYGQCRRHAPSPPTDVLQKIGNSLGAIAWATEETANIGHYPDPDDKHRQEMDYGFEGDDVDHVGGWPRTRGCEWCAEFLALPPEQITARTALIEKHKALRNT